METRQRVNDVEQSTPSRVADAEAFLTAVRKEHARFIDALGHAAVLLGGGSPQLEQARATQVQLTRQFLDAQRSILQLRSETDRELALIGAVPGCRAAGELELHDDVAAAQKQQLSAVLDQWWADETELRRTVLDEARQAVHAHLAHLATSQTEVAVELPSAATRVLADLEVANTSELHSLLDELISSLDTATATATVSRPTPTPAPNDLRIIDMVPGESFSEFWLQHEPAEAAVAPTRQRWSLPLAVYPVAAVASALTLAMAWIG